MNYKSYKHKIAQFAKKEYKFEGIDFEDKTVEDICQTDFRLGSFPYYCANEILLYLERKND